MEDKKIHGTEHERKLVNDLLNRHGYVDFGRLTMEGMESTLLCLVASLMNEKASPSDLEPGVYTVVPILKACPCCGGQSHFVEVGVGLFQAVCQECELRTPVRENKSVVAKAWNERYDG